MSKNVFVVTVKSRQVFRDGTEYNGSSSVWGVYTSRESVNDSIPNAPTETDWMSFDQASISDSGIRRTWTATEHTINDGR